MSTTTNDLLTDYDTARLNALRADAAFSEARTRLLSAISNGKNVKATVKQYAAPAVKTKAKRHLSEETKQKMRAAQQKRWADKKS